MERDSFRGVVPATTSLNKAAGTRPLAAAGGSPTVELAGKALDGVIELLRKALGQHEPVIELLYRACQDVPLAIPGVGRIELRHARTAKGDEIVVYLVGALGRVPTLPKRVQVAVFRFYDAEAGAQAGEALLAEDRPAPPTMVEGLRLKLFYLMHYHMEFADEPVLSQLFPGPRTLQAQAGAPVSAVERLKRKSKLQAALAKADVLYYQLQPHMGAIASLVKLLREPPAFSARDLFSAETRMQRMMLFRIGDDRRARELLEQGLAAFAKLEAAIARAREKEDPEGLEEACFPLTGFLQACREHPALRDVVHAG